MAEYLYFPGCTIPYRENNYEKSARAVASELGITLLDMPEYNCCGLNVSLIDEEAALLYSARNLALAEEQGKDIVTLCNGCYKTLSMVNKKLQDDTLLSEINKSLAKIDKKYSKGVNVKHFSELLLENKEQIKGKLKKNFNGLEIASFTGCHATRPSEFVSFDDPEVPEKLDSLVELVGGKPVDYLDKNKCCGAPLLALSEELGMKIAQERLRGMKNAGAKAMVVMCPFCHISFDSMQVKIQEEFKEEFNITSLYITQLIGLALGLSDKDLGIDENKIKADELIAKIQ